MDYVVDFVGSHKECVILDKMIGNHPYQPVELDDTLDQEDYEELKEFLANASKVYAYVDNVDGPERHRDVYIKLLNDINIITVTKNI